MEKLPPLIDATPRLTPVRPPQGSPNDRASVEQVDAPPPVSQAGATLDFLDPAAFEKTEPLAFPFRLGGEEIRVIRIRRPTVEQVAQWTARNIRGEADTWDLYAIMTGLPAPVLRGLEVDDGGRVLEAARDFLPRWLRTGSASPVTPPAGADTP